MGLLVVVTMGFDIKGIVFEEIVGVFGVLEEDLGEDAAQMVVEVLVTFGTLNGMKEFFQVGHLEI